MEELKYSRTGESKRVSIAKKLFICFLYLNKEIQVS